MKTETKIFITLFLTYAFFTNTYLTSNDASRFSLTAGIAEEGRLKIDNYMESVISEFWRPKDFSIYQGDKYSDKAPLGSFLGVPIYYLARQFTSDQRVLIYLVSLFTSGLLTALTALLIYWIGGSYGADENTRVAVAVGYGLGTMAFLYGTIFFSHAITTFFSFSSFYVMYRAEEGEKGRLALAGLLAGLAVISDYYAGAIAAALLAYALWKRRRESLWFMGGLLISVALLGLYQWHLFDDPFTPTYRYSNLYQKYHSAGFYGITLPSRAFFQRLFEMLFTPWGFFFVNPLVLLAVAGLPGFFRKAKSEAALTVFISLCLLYVEGSIGRFDGYSARFLTPALPFLFILMYSLNLKDEPSRSIFRVLLFISFMVNAVGVDTFLQRNPDPRVLIAEAGTHNLLGGYLLSRGVDAGVLSVAPLFLFYGLVWRKGVISYLKGMVRA